MKILVFFLTSLTLLSGCMTVQDTIFLQEVDVSTPLIIPPLQLSSEANKGKITFSPKFYINKTGRVEGTINHSPVNSSGIYEVDSVDERLQPSKNNSFTYSGKNIRWNLPDFFAGMDLDLPVSESAALTGGISFSSAEGTQLLGGNLGLSFFRLSDHSAIRLSGGISLQEYSYSARTVVERKVTEFGGRQYTSVYFYKDTDKGADFNIYLSLLYNTNFTEFPVNFYLGAAFFRQSLFDFKPRQTDEFYNFPWVNYSEVDARGEYSGSFFNLAPGIFKDFENWGRIVGGVNFVLGNSITNATETSFLIPFIKFEFFM